MPTEYLKCVDCKNEFEFSENDQQFFADKGFEKPKRCRDCREAKKKRFGDNNQTRSNY